MSTQSNREKQLEYIGRMAVELKKMAQEVDESFLATILDMAAMEARRGLIKDDSPDVAPQILSSSSTYP